MEPEIFAWILYGIAMVMIIFSNESNELLMGALILVFAMILRPILTKLSRRNNN